MRRLSALALSAAALCGLTACSMLSAEEAPAPQAPAAFVFEIETPAPRAMFADRVAEHALRCWVRDDPTYRVGGPFNDAGALVVTLMYLGETEPPQPARQALSLSIPPSETGAYAVAARGPLATPEYEARLLEGLTLAGAGSDRCN